MRVASFSRKNMGRHLGLREKLLRPGIGLGAVLQPAKVSSAWSAHYRRKTEINCGNYIEERQETGWKVRSVDKNRRCDKKQKVP